jgi:hypothetical protein
MAATKTARKASTRTIRLVVREEGSTPGVVRIEANRKTALYSFREIPNELGVGRAFLIREISPSEEGTEQYQCIATEDEQTCSCKGHQRFGRCKHSDGLAALVIGGRI